MFSLYYIINLENKRQSININLTKNQQKYYVDYTLIYSTKNIVYLLTHTPIRKNYLFYKLFNNNNIDNFTTLLKKNKFKFIVINCSIDLLDKSIRKYIKLISKHVPYIFICYKKIQ